MIVEYELWVDDCMEASTSGPDHEAFSEILRYAYQYAEDGEEVIIYKVTREVIMKGMITNGS